MRERKTVRKWFWAWDFEKEEQWLNMMAQSGWVLDGIGFCTYHFIACEPGEYTVRLEMHNHDPEYLDFMAETEAEYVGRMTQWIYFRKKAVHGAFDIFSDLDSKIAHLDKIGKMLLLVGIANLLIGFAAICSIARMGVLDLLCATVIMYGLGRIHGKKEALEKARAFRE